MEQQLFVEPLPTVEESLSGKTNGAGDVKLIMEPGTEWKYSGGGYTLAQLVIEEVTGKPFAEYVEEAVVRPLGMRLSGYELTPLILETSADAHDMWGEVTPGPRFTAQAAAGFHGTIEDMQGLHGSIQGCFACGFVRNSRKLIILGMFFQRFKDGLSLFSCILP